MKLIVALTAAFICLAISMPADAGVVIQGTRVIFPGGDREVIVKLSNEGKTPSLVQAWLDNGDPGSDPGKVETPFILSPTMFRLDPGKEQTLRLLYTGEPLPQDKESLYWLNVLEIPPKSTEDKNKIQIAYRSRIKVMYRPKGLPGKAGEAPAQLIWSISAKTKNSYQLMADNPTPYVVNLGGISLHSGDKNFDAGTGYVLPGQAQQFEIPELTVLPTKESEVEIDAIDDWGGIKSLRKKLSSMP